MNLLKGLGMAVGAAAILKLAGTKENNSSFCAEAKQVINS
jgi:hypothetical protein